MLIAAVLTPIAAGALLPLLRFRSDRSRGIYVEASVLVASAIAGLAIFKPDVPRVLLFRITETLSVSFHVDGLSRVFAALVIFLWPLASLYAIEYMRGRERQDFFFSFYTMTYGVTLGIAVSGNLLTLYLFYELMTLSTLPLVMYGGSVKSVSAGLKYLYYSLGGAAFAFVGMIYVMYYSGGTTYFTLGGLFGGADRGSLENLRFGYLLSFFGFGVKAAVFPLHRWLPDASVAPTPVTALLHAVAVVKAGVFSIIRVTYYSFGASILAGSLAQHLPMALCAFTIVFGCATALRETNLKRRLAYSTVSNLSYILLGVLLMSPRGLAAGLLHMVFHALMKIVLFFAAGVYLRADRPLVQDLRGVHRVMPLTTGVFLLGSLAMTGVPPLAGFISKWALAGATVAAGGVLPLLGTVALLTSSLLTTIYLLVPSVSAYFSPLAPGDAPASASRSDGGWMISLTLVTLCVAMLLTGVFSEPLAAFLSRVAEDLV